MKSTHKFISCLGITAFLCSGAFAQSAGAEMNHFVKDGLAFEYPGGWSISDESTPQALQVIVSRKGSSVQVMIIANRGITLRNELPAANLNITEPLVKKVAIKVGAAGGPAERTAMHIQVGAIEAEGVRLRASTTKRPKTGEVLWLRMHLRPINLAFIRSDADEAQGSQLWQTILTSLRLDAPALGVTTILGSSGNTKIESGVLNGKALELPAPAYPSIARTAHASGIVRVQVVINEQGNVISAHAISGNPLLQVTCVAAARKARFWPTLLEGEPVRVTGIITYNFVAQ